MESSCAVLIGKDSVELLSLQTPELREGEILVKICYTGLCGTQIGEIRGTRGEDKFIPHLLGHEASGIVMKIGKDVTTVNVGDKVVCTWMRGIGQDGLPKRYSLLYNAGPITTFQEYSVIPENRIIPIPNDMDLRIACLWGCAIPTGAGSIINILKMDLNKDIIIYGCGNTGSMAILAAKLYQPRNIAVVDKNIERLKYALDLGANIFYKDISEVKEKYDYALETTGNLNVMNFAINSIKDSGKVCIAGNLKPNEKISVDPIDLNKGKIYGSWGGFKDRNNVNLEQFIWDYYKTLDLNNVKITEYSLKDIKKAIQDFDTVIGKIVIKIAD